MPEIANPFATEIANPFAPDREGEYFSQITGAMRGAPSGWVGPTPSRAIEDIEGGQEYLDLAEKNREGRRGFFEELFDPELEQTPFIGAAVIPRLFGVARAAKQVRDGEPVSDEDLVALNQYLEFQKRKAGASWSAKTLDVVQGSLAFGAEIAATTILSGLLAPELVTTAAGGAIAAQTASKKVATKAARKATQMFITKHLGQKAGILAGKTMVAGIRGNAIHSALSQAMSKGMSTAVAKRTGSNAVAKYLGKITEVAVNLETRALLNQALHPERTVSAVAERRIRNEIAGGDESVAASVAKGIMDMNFEYASEFSGQYFGQLARRLLPPKAIKALGQSVLFKTAVDFGDDATLRGAHRVLRTMGVDSAVEEMMEERAGDFMRGLFGVHGEAGLTNAVKQSWPSAEQFTIEAAAFSAMPLMASGINRITGGVTSGEMAENMAFARRFGRQRDVYAVTEAENLAEAQELERRLQLERQPWYVDSGFDFLTKIFGKERRGTLSSIARRGGVNLIRVRDQAVERERILAEKQDRKPDPDVGAKALADILRRMQQVQIKGIQTKADKEAFNAGVKSGDIIHHRTAREWGFFASDKALSSSDFEKLVRQTGISTVVDLGDFQSQRIHDLAGEQFGKQWGELTSDEKAELQERWNYDSPALAKSRYDFLKSLYDTGEMNDILMHEVLPMVIAGTEAQYKAVGRPITDQTVHFDFNTKGAKRYLRKFRAVNTVEGGVADVDIGINTDRWGIAEDVIEGKLKLNNALDLFPEANAWMDQLQSDLASKKDRTKAEETIFSALETKEGRFEFFVNSYMLNRMGYDTVADNTSLRFKQDMPAEFDPVMGAIVGDKLLAALTLVQRPEQARGERHEKVLELTAERGAGRTRAARKITRKAAKEDEQDPLVVELDVALQADMRKPESRERVQRVLSAMDRQGVTFSLQVFRGEKAATGREARFNRIANYLMERHRREKRREPVGTDRPLVEGKTPINISLPDGTIRRMNDGTILVEWADNSDEFFEGHSPNVWFAVTADGERRQLSPEQSQAMTNRITEMMKQVPPKAIKIQSEPGKLRLINPARIRPAPQPVAPGPFRTRPDPVPGETRSVEGVFGGGIEVGSIMPLRETEYPTPEFAEAVSDIDFPLSMRRLKAMDKALNAQELNPTVSEEVLEDMLRIRNDYAERLRLEGTRETQRFSITGRGRSRTVTQAEGRSRAGKELLAARAAPSLPLSPVKQLPFDIDPAEIVTGSTDAAFNEMIDELFGEEKPKDETDKISTKDVERDERGLVKKPRPFWIMEELGEGPIGPQIQMIVPFGSRAAERVAENLVAGGHASRANVSKKAIIKIPFKREDLSPEENATRYEDMTDWLRSLLKKSPGKLQNWDVSALRHLFLPMSAVRDPNLDIEGVIAVVDYSPESTELRQGLPIQRTLHTALSGNAPQGKVYPVWTATELESGVKQMDMQVDADEVLGEIDEDMTTPTDFADKTQPTAWYAASFPITSQRIDRIAANLERGRTDPVFKELGEAQLEQLANDIHDWMRRNKIRRIMLGGLDKVEARESYDKQKGDETLRFPSDEVVSPAWEATLLRALAKAMSAETSKARQDLPEAQPIEIDPETQKAMTKELELDDFVKELQDAMNSDKKPRSFSLEEMALHLSEDIQTNRDRYTPAELMAIGKADTLIFGAQPLDEADRAILEAAHRKLVDGLERELAGVGITFSLEEAEPALRQTFEAISGDIRSSWVNRKTGVEPVHVEVAQGTAPIEWTEIAMEQLRALDRPITQDDMYRTINAALNKGKLVVVPFDYNYDRHLVDNIGSLAAATGTFSLVDRALDAMARFDNLETRQFLTDDIRDTYSRMATRALQGDEAAKAYVWDHLTKADKEAFRGLFGPPIEAPAAAVRAIPQPEFDFRDELDTMSMAEMDSIFSETSPLFSSGDIALHRVLIEEDRRKRAEIQAATARADRWRKDVGLLDPPENLPEEHQERAQGILNALGAHLDDSTIVPTEILYREDEGNEVDGPVTEEVMREWDEYIAANGLDMPTAKELAADMRAEYDEARKRANEALKQLTYDEWIRFLDDYINHNYIHRTPEEMDTAVRRMREDTKVAKERRIPTYQEAAEKYGLMPVTMDVTRLYQTWNRTTWAAERNKSILSLASLIQDADGSPMVIPIRTGEVQRGVSPVIDDRVLRQSGRQLAQYLNVPYDESLEPQEAINELTKDLDLNEHDLVRMDSPYTSSISYFLVKKGNAESIMKSVLNYGRWDNKYVNALERFNAWSKFMMLGFSAFHPFALLESFSAVQGITWDNPAFHPLRTRNALKQLVKEMRTSPELWEKWVRAGLMVDVGNPDVKLSIIDQDLKKSIDMLTEEAGRRGPKSYVAKVLLPGLKGLRSYKEWLDKWLWHEFHPAIKLHSANFVFDAWEAENPDATEDETLRAREDVARYINDAFGGQDWNEYVWATPFARQAMHLGIFAPDWTTSAANVAGATRLPGVGRMHASNLSPLARDQMLRKYWPAMTAIVLMGIPNLIQSLIYGAFGDPDEGDEPFTFMNEPGKGTHIDFTPLLRHMPGYRGGDSGRRRVYMRWGKQAWEVFDGWYKNPLDMLLRKSSSLVRAGFEQVTGHNTALWELPFKDEGYLGILSAEGSFWKGRVGHVAQKFVPMSVLSVAQGRPTTFIAPVSRGVTAGSVAYSMEKTLEGYIDRDALPKQIRDADLEVVVADLIGAAEANGVDSAIAFKRAKARVASKYYREFFQALNAGKESKMEESAEKLIRLGKGLEDIGRSIENRLSSVNQDYEPDLKQRVKDSFNRASE